MTHQTDEELDALVQRLHGTPLYEGHGEASETPERAADAITALRAQLAEAALTAQPLRSGWADVMSSAIQRFEVAAAVNGSATWNSIGSKAMAELLKELSRHVDRAEAALAA